MPEIEKKIMIKIFSDSDSYKIEKEVNEFLQDNRNWRILSTHVTSPTCFEFSGASEYHYPMYIVILSDR